MNLENLPRFRRLAPPPRWRPRRDAGLLLSDLHTLRNIDRTHIYLWLSTGDEFWAHPTDFDCDNLYGLIWRDGCWRSAKIPLRLIRSYH